MVAAGSSPRAKRQPPAVTPEVIHRRRECVPIRSYTSRPRCCASRARRCAIHQASCARAPGTCRPSRARHKTRRARPAPFRRGSRGKSLALKRGQTPFSNWRERGLPELITVCDQFGSGLRRSSSCDEIRLAAELRTQYRISVTGTSPSPARSADASFARTARAALRRRRNPWRDRPSPSTPASSCTARCSCRS